MQCYITWYVLAYKATAATFYFVSVSDEFRLCLPLFTIVFRNIKWHLWSLHSNRKYTFSLCPVRAHALQPVHIMPEALLSSSEGYQLPTFCTAAKQSDMTSLESRNPSGSVRRYSSAFLPSVAA